MIVCNIHIFLIALPLLVTRYVEGARIGLVSQRQRCSDSSKSESGLSVFALRADPDNRRYEG
jgi:hypothetical protein